MILYDSRYENKYEKTNGMKCDFNAIIIYVWSLKENKKYLQKKYFRPYLK